MSISSFPIRTKNITGLDQVTSTAGSNKLILVSGTGAYLLTVSDFASTLSGVSLTGSTTGVSSINGATGALTLTGSGNAYVIRNGNTFIISGDTGIYSSFVTTSQTGQFAASGNLFSTGINLQNQITNITSWTGTTPNIFAGVNHGHNYVTSLGTTGSINTGSFTGNALLSGAGNITTYTGDVATKLIIVSGNTGAYANFVTPGMTGLLTGQFVSRSETGGFGGGSSAAGVSSVGATGITNTGFFTGNILFSGAGNIVVSTGDNSNKLIVVSGNTGAYANFTTPNATGLLTGQFYPLGSNPAGYLTSSSAGVTSIIATGNINTGSVTGVVKISGAGNITVFTGVSGLIIVSGDTGAYSSFVATSQTGQFVTTGQTGQLTNVFYPLNSNPSNYLTVSSNVGVRTITTTGAYPSGTISGNVTISGTTNIYVSTGINGTIVVSGDTGNFVDNAKLINTSGVLVSLINASNAGVSSLNGLSGVLNLIGSGNISIFTGGQGVTVSGNTGAYANFVSLSQTGGFLTLGNVGGVRTITATGTTQSGIVSGNIIMTGAGNASVFIDASGILNVSGNTGAYANFVTPSQTGLLTGQFYPLNLNPAGYLTSINGGVSSIVITGNINTGSITGSVKISGAGNVTTYTGESGLAIISGDTGAYSVFALKSDTGQFVVQNQTGVFLTLNNVGGVRTITTTGSYPSGIVSGSVILSGAGNISIVTGVNSNIVISGSTGSLTGTFYPRYTNPSGYIMGTIGAQILNGQLLIGSSGINGFQQGDLYGTTGIVILSGSGSLGVGIDASKVVTGLIGGTNVTVSNNGTGLWTVNATAGGNSGVSSITATGTYPSGIVSGNIILSGAGNVSVYTGINNSIIVSGNGASISNAVTSLNTFTGAVNLTGLGTIVISTGSYGTINVSGGNNTVTNLYSVANFSGSHNIWIPAAAMTPSQTTGAITGSILTASSGHTIDTLVFNSGSGQSAYFNLSFPPVWDKTNVVPIFYWTTTGNVGTINWGISAADIKDGSSLDIQYNEGAIISDSTISGNYLHQTTGAPLTISGSLTDNDQCYFKVYRSAGGSLASDSKLIGIGIGYYETGLNATSTSGVTSLNSLTGALNLTGAGTITITTGVSGTITISGSAGGGQGGTAGVNSIATTGIINTGYFTGDVMFSGAGNITTFTGNNSNKLIIVSGNTGAYSNFVSLSQTGGFLTLGNVGGVRTVTTTGTYPSGTTSGNIIVSGVSIISVTTGINGAIVISGNTGSYANFLTSTSLTPYMLVSGVRDDGYAPLDIPFTIIKTGIDFTQTGYYRVYTVPTNLFLAPDSFEFITKSGSGITIGAGFGVGSGTGLGFSEFISGYKITSVNRWGRSNFTLYTDVLTGGQNINLNIYTGSTGVGSIIHTGYFALRGTLYSGI